MVGVKRVRPSFILATALLLLALSASVLTSYAWYNSPYPWSQSQHDSQHTGASASPSPSSNSTLWTYAPSGGRAISLVVDDGLVFALQSTGFFVLDETTGVLILSVPVGHVYGGNVAGAYADGKFYLTTVNSMYNIGEVYCFNATSGTLIWMFSTSPGLIALPPVVSENRVYVGTLNNYLYCIEEGVQKWYKQLGGAIYSTPAVDGDLLCVGCDDGILYAFDINGPQPVSLWNFTVGLPIRGPITIEGGKVYLGYAADGYLYVLDQTTGNLIWSWQADGSYHLDIAVAYGIVYVGVKAGTQSAYPIYALYANATAGNYTYGSPEPRLWTDGSNTARFSGFAVSGNKLIYSHVGGTVLIAKNALTGINLWRFTTDWGVTAPLVADGHVFIADQSRVYCMGEPYPPSTNVYHVDAGGQSFDVALETNSTITGFNTTALETRGEISFEVAGINETVGMCNATIPNDMLDGVLTVTVDGEQPLSSAPPLNNGTHTSISFTYNNTFPHAVEISGTTFIPEFPATVILPTLITTLFIAIICIRSKHAR